MRSLLTVILLLNFVCLNAQYKSGTLYFKDGKTNEGLIKTRKLGGVKFKLKNDSKAIAYDSDDITGFDTGNKKYRYKNVKNSSKKLYQLLIIGKFNLYSLELTGSGHPIPNSGGATFGGGTSIIYFIERSNRFLRLGPKIKKSHFEYFSDCPTLIEKIKKKDIKKKNVRSIIDYYNRLCK